MSAISRALARLKAGKMIILVDNEHRENEGDLVCGAEFATPEAVNFMIRFGRGLVCLSLPPEKVDQLGLAPMVFNNRTLRQTGFTVSIEAKVGVTTGISAFDRAQTIAAAITDRASANDLVSPGHVFPLRAVQGGSLVRNGHTEASIDLARMAGLKPAAVICEIVNDNGTMARRPDLERFAIEHDLPLVTIEEVITHRMATETLVEEVARAKLPVTGVDAPFEVRAFRSLIDGSEHLAITLGDLRRSHSVMGNQNGELRRLPPLVRVHSECLTGDAFGSLRCDCGAQLQAALNCIAAEGIGAVVYMRGHEGRGIGLANKIRAYALQDQGRDTVDANMELGLPADGRDYGIATQILKALGARRIRLMTNNPKKASALLAYGLEEVERVSLEISANGHNSDYLATKKTRLGHLLTLTDRLERQGIE